MHDIPSVTDEYAAYAYLSVRQSCLIHILRRAEKCAVRSGKGSDLIPYLLLLGMYFRVKRMDTAPPEAVAELEGQVRAIADMYGEGHEINTALTNSLPTMFTFLKHPGIPPHNNRAEQELHAGPSKEKRVRRQLKNHNGMRCMSVLSTVFRTAENLGVWPSTVVRMTARDPDWDMCAHADGPGRPLARRPGARQPFRAPPPDAHPSTAQTRAANRGRSPAPVAVGPVRRRAAARRRFPTQRSPSLRATAPRMPNRSSLGTPVKST